MLVAVTFLVANLCGSMALAFAPVGPPTAGLKTEQWSLGFDYAHGEIDFDIEWSSDFASGIADAKAKDMKSDSYLAKFGYGVTDEWEFYSFLGAADSRGKIEWYGETDDFDGGYDVSGGFGTKWTFLKDENLSWGLVYQMSWIQGDDSYSVDLSSLGLGTQEIDAALDSFDIFLALGPTYKMENWSIYGGLGLYYFDADIDIDLMDTTILEGDADETSFGGYVGTAIDLDANASLYAEYMLTNDAWAIGTGFVWRF